MVIYFDSTGTQVNAITLLDYLGLLVLNNIFLRTLRNIKDLNIAFI